MMGEERGMFSSVYGSEQAHKGFKIIVPEKFNFGFDVIDRHAEDEKSVPLYGSIRRGSQSRNIPIEIFLASLTRLRTHFAVWESKRAIGCSFCSAVSRNGTSSL